MKISCKGKIPPETADEKEQLEELIRQGKNNVAKDIGMSPLTDNFFSSDGVVESLSDTDHVEVSVPHAETHRVSTESASSKPMTVTDELYCVNQTIQQGYPSVDQSFPQTPFASTAFPTQYNIPGFDFHNPFMPQPYYYVPQHQQYIVPQYQPLFTNTIGQRATTLQETCTAWPEYVPVQRDPNNEDPNNVTHPENGNTKEHGTETLLELAEVASHAE